MIDYWDSKYPTYVEVPENYWVFSHNIEYSSKENDND
tara:strand:- start:202 stop:312 length:111 start_codon:yes stop_codon:yes gene_type:complete